MATTEQILNRLSRPLNRIGTWKRDSGHSTGEATVDLFDIVDDLAEVRYLIDDLSRAVAGSESGENAVDSRDHLDEWFLTNFGRSLNSLKSRQRRYLDLVERAARWASDEDLLSLLASTRREYLQLKSAVRQAYKQVGSMLCAADWQSPVYAASVPFELNRLSQGIAEHSLDYKRDGHLDALAYEQQFIEQYASQLGSHSLKAYLTTSGMAAFSTVLHWLSGELNIGQESLAIQPMYFENLHLSRCFFPDIAQMESRSKEELLACLRGQKPSVVFCDAVANCGQVLSHDITTILRWAADEADGEVVIVIDTTCQPSVLLPMGLLKRLPENVCVILVESLAKYHQFGMDGVTGGVVILHAADALHDSFRKTRARLGTNIADASVGSLPQPNRDQLTSRLKRHSRNTQVVAEHLESEINDQVGIIESLSWLREGADGTPWFRGSCFTLRLHKPLQSIELYREFENRVLELARRKNLPVALSTSFGFDVSRLYVTAPSTRFEDPFLRVSIGTETRQEIDTLVDVLLTASSELARAWEFTADGSERNSGFSEASFRPAMSVIPTEPSESISAWSRGQCPPLRGPRFTRNELREWRDLTPVRAGLNPAPTSSRFTRNNGSTGCAPVTNDNPISGLDRSGRAGSVYTGEDALKNYLNPSNYPPTPLVELPVDLNPFKADGVRLYAKMMSLVPLMNIKSLPAFSMLSKAAERGELGNVEKIIESSSSNTVLSLSVMARLFGVDTTCALVDHSIAPNLLRMLRLFGLEVFMHAGPGHELFTQVEPRSERATAYGKQAGWFNPGQYSNPDNPQGFAEWLAPDLWDQTRGRLGILSCALGTCGTMVGISQLLRQRNPQLQVVANCPAPGQAVPGPREQMQLADVTFDWKDVANARMDVTAQESFSASVKLLRRGILGGPSSGMNYAGLLRYIEQEKAEGRLESMIGSKGEVSCVFVCCDSPLPHVADYYQVLGEEYFPTVHPVPTPDQSNTQ